MATSMGALVEALKDDLGAEALIVDGSLYTDNQLARTLRASLRYLRGRLPSHIPALTFASLDVNDNVTVASTVSPEIDPDGRFGALLMAIAKFKLAEQGAHVRAKQSLGSVSSAAGSFSQSSRSTGLRMVEEDARKEMEQQIWIIKGGETLQIESSTNVATDTVQTTVT